ncbi:MAG: aminoglycoside phosphotransferase family protein [Janthinobacterium lividum]
MNQATSDLRLAQLREWLSRYSDAPRLDVSTLTPVAADASSRRYFRLQATSLAGPEGSTQDSLIAMDAPPPEKCREFATVQALMDAAQIKVPKIYAADFEHGFMLLSDLGSTSYLQRLQAPELPAGEARALMRAALDTLIAWQRATRAEVLPPYDAAFLRRELELFPEWYLQRHLGIEVSATQRTALDTVFARLVDAALAQPTVFVHRDFMPRNLMLGSPGPGVLDFQDALMGPISYDVASLLRDAFLSWDEDFQLDCIAWYWERAKRAGLPVRADFAEFYRELEWMGLQRHLKVLGIFARLAHRDAKPAYLSELPRFLGYARHVAARYRELAPLVRLLDQIENREAGVTYSF